jgi:hypothetical protein
MYFIVFYDYIIKSKGKPIFRSRHYIIIEKSCIIHIVFVAWD